MKQNTLLNHLNRPTQGVPSYVKLEDAFYPQNATVDSWFYTGNHKADGIYISFLLHFIEMDSENGRVIKTCFSVTDHLTGEYIADDTVILAKDNIFNQDGQLTIQSDTYKAVGDLNEIRLTGQFGQSSIDLTVKPQGAVINNGGSGYYPIVMNIKENTHFSIPYMTMTGNITLNGKSHTVSGNCWLDRQYQQFTLGFTGGEPVHPGAWAWLGIAMEDRTAISIWDYPIDGINHTFASIVFPNGRQAVVEIDSITKNAKDIWVSPKTARRYPTHWVVNIPEFDIALDIKANPKGQEIVASYETMHKYEGSSAVVGVIKGKNVEGHCMIELSGPWL